MLRGGGACQGFGGGGGWGTRGGGGGVGKAMSSIGGLNLLRPQCGGWPLALVAPGDQNLRI